MPIRTFLVFVALMALLAIPAKADFIVALAPSTGLANVGGPPAPPGVAGKVTAYSFQGPDRIVTNGINGPVNGGAVTNDDFTGAGNPNFVNVDIDVFQMNSPMDIVFTVQPQTSLPPAGDPIGPVEYFFTVNMRNRLNDNNSQPGVDGREIGGFRVELVPGGALAAFDTPQNPNFSTVPGADLFPLGFNGFITPTLVSFGGFSGGGGGLGYGNTVGLRFSVDVPGSSSVSPPRTFALRFTANPEPGSLALAALLGTAGFGFYRRRKGMIESV